MLDSRRAQGRTARPSSPVHLGQDDVSRLWRHVAQRIFEVHGVCASRPPAADGLYSPVCQILNRCDGLADAIARVDVAFACGFLRAHHIARAKKIDADELSRSWCGAIAAWAPNLTSKAAALAQLGRIKAADRSAAQGARS